MQHLVEVGRNRPCPCGSGRKFKKCCLDTQVAAVVGGMAELDVVALVDNAIETGDWAAVDPHVDRALELFVRGGPLEHVRFRGDLGSFRDHDVVELAKLCTTGWLNRCALELARVLDRYRLEPDERNGLRMAVHLLRRFGAHSPIVEELARLQIDERSARERRVSTALLGSGFTTDDAVKVGLTELGDWIRRVRPPILTFADWFALRAATDDQFSGVWSSGVSPRISDYCLDRLDDSALADRRSWTLLATLALLARVPELGEVLLIHTPLRTPTADEHAIYQALREKQYGGPRPNMLQVINATESRGDVAGAALLREAMRVLQHEFLDVKARKR